MRLIPARDVLERQFERFSEAARAAIQPLRRNADVVYPIRGQTLSTEQLELRARELAGQHRVERRAGSARPLLAALKYTERLLVEAHHTFGADAKAHAPIPPAAEWLLDNFHIVVDQIREVRRDLPQGYYHQLPKLTNGSHQGLPRTYALAIDLIEHTDGRIDSEQLVRFLSAYQSVMPLTIGEVWSLPIMLRVGLVENLGRLARISLDNRKLRSDADLWAERLLARHSPGALEGHPVLREMTRRYPQLPPPFAVQLLRRLRGSESEIDVGALIAWLEQHPALPYQRAEDLIHAEHHRQAANQVSVANTITSMRTLNATDWPGWFERVCLTEQVLRQDPSGAYARSTFATRDRYRHELETLSRRSGRPEDEIARLLVDQAARSRAAGRPEHEAHIGYMLVDQGRPAFERLIGYTPARGEELQHALRRHPTAVYLGAIAGATAGIVAAGVRAAAPRAPLGEKLIGAGLLLLPASALATELVNRSVARVLKPRLLPRLDLRNGIPPDLRTMVVVPTLLLTQDSVRGQIDALEVLALANQDPALHFALLSDFADAPAPASDDDTELLATAIERIRALNMRYGANRFFLFHRRRVWNDRQNRWMGWERKRGKLEEFNRLLAGEQDTTYDVTIGDQSVLPQVRYVITLDADTQLPRDAARALVGTIAHPLNQAVVDPQQRRVVSGYGILQPRVGIDVPSATASRFARASSGNVGVDPYTTAVSDVYMDLFGEGIYAGKGIYDPHALRATIEGRFPENTLLSHDLIEGSYARAALLSDVELIDGYPTTYAAYAARHHRWVRGDWQIARWLLPLVPGGDGTLERNVLPLSARYKIFDNLRRSLVPPATLALLVAGWLGLPGRPWAWTALGLAHYAAPLLLNLRLRPDISAVRLDAIRLALNTALLPDQAALNIDAIVRTLARLLITRRNLLEWETAAQSQRRLTNSARSLMRSTLPTLAGGALLAWLRFDRLREAWPAALPVSAAWGSAPALAAWLDQPYLVPTPQPASSQENVLLRRLARATWGYFERYVVEEQHFLAPDNVQETPQHVVAARTSPTNIGLQLLADLAAADFGYLGVADLADRTGRVFSTLERLDRFHGHLLNWYDTATLKPLPPTYVSTVDSGNLAGHLLALRHGLLELRNRPVVGAWTIDGLRDTLGLARERLPADAREMRDRLAALSGLLESEPTTLAGYRALLDDIAARASALDAPGEAGLWVTALARQARSLLRDLDALTLDGREELAPISLAEAVAEPQGCAALLCDKLEALAEHCTALVVEMDFGFLYDDQRKLFAIGYNLAEGRRDGSFYDLFASEARLASFIAIAKGEVPQEHWFHMGRTLTPAAPIPTLLSWSGTMFEYLMPFLVMRRYPETLLDSTARGAVMRQIAYGREHSIPWGISESGYNARDLAMNYQYRAFGVPGLGLQSGLSEDLVVAPYATLLALPVDPLRATANLARLTELGMNGRYGLYEAIDFTPERLPPGESYAIVRSYMVHHQGMGLLALGNYLHGDRMQQRFHSEPIVQATEMLLQEKIPQTAPLALPPPTTAALHDNGMGGSTLRQFTTPHTAVPHAHFLSSGGYTVALTNAGSGFSRARGLAVTRWRPDTTTDAQGSFIYLRDARSGATWSPAYQPLHVLGDNYRVAYTLEKVEYRQRVAGIDSRLEVTISPEDHAEVRRVSLTNLTAEPREIEVTSYMEVVLAAAQADAAHPAFSNLFVETEYLAHQHALLATRRPRAADAQRLWAVHVAAVRGATLGEAQYETDRAAFLGRGRGVANPQALDRALSGRSGAVLDPIMSLRWRVRIAPGATTQVIFTTAVVEDREAAERLADRYNDHVAAARAFEMAWTQSRVELRHIGVDPDEAHRFQRLASLALYPDPLRRAPAEVLARNTKGQASLWAYGISGDEPIILARIGGDDMSLVGELLEAHEFWRLKGLLIDLVLLNEEAGGYRQGRQEQILTMVRGSRAGRWLNERGGIFVLRSDLVPEEDQVLLQTVARLVLSNRRGDLSQQLRRRAADVAGAPGSLGPARAVAPGEAPPAGELQHRTAYGGFSADGREFIVEVDTEQPTPAPWINVVANDRAGFIVSERGAGYSWAENSREHRLTPWANDPVGDAGGEAIYLRDERSSEIWSPTPFPSGAGRFLVRHGFGYSVFAHERREIASTLSLSIAPKEPVKLMHLHLENRSGAARKLSATIYVEWVMGVLREQEAPYLVTAWDAEANLLLARNSYSQEFAGRVGFLSASAQASAFTGDRATFLGRNGWIGHPAWVERNTHEGAVGAGLDPCGALRCDLTLEPGGSADLTFILGAGASEAEARTLAQRYRDQGLAARAADQTRQYWQDMASTLQVHTPAADLDVLLNGWLLYQALACRVVARSALYQSGGAYGFRDQIQDVLALMHAAPEIARAHLLRAAARQFVEGDVQHWWHPPSGRGIRTTFSDDYLWMPFAVAHYIDATGDADVLDEQPLFLEGRPLRPGEAEYYDLPEISDERASLYEHCLRAIDLAIGRMGAHGLPLMGAGDWNDGMNMVGHAGRGESVWVAWFLASTLDAFAPLAERRGEQERAEQYLAEARRLREAVEIHAWDGAWYLRAFYDDGTPMGSATSQECQIDSLVQSWAVIAGGDPERALAGMQAVDQRLVDREAGLIRLFDPAFDEGEQNPGYIKGYVPGVRENGGQYTHAAIWVIWAWTMLGEGERAFELLQLINPVRHGQVDPERYRVEPYVIAADVYTAESHLGRGGWTWYTGSAGWFYRLGVEQVLGLRRRGGGLEIDPCIPPAWPGFSAELRVGGARYRIEVTRGEQPGVSLDGQALVEARVPLDDDGGEHTIHVVIGPDAKRVSAPVGELAAPQPPGD